MAPPRKQARTESQKQFADYTVAELQDAVDRNATLEKELAAKTEELSKYAVDNDVVAERIKTAISKQLLLQMLPESDLPEKEAKKLRGNGKEIIAIIPNVSDTAKIALGLEGCEGQTKPMSKRSHHFFPSRVMKPLSAGASLQLGALIEFRFVKTTCELKAVAQYKFVPKPKPKPKAKRAPKRVDAAEDGGDDQEEGTQQEEGEEGEAADADGGTAPMEDEAAEQEEYEEDAPAAEDATNEPAASSAKAAEDIE